MNAFNTVVKFFQDSGLFIYPSILIMALGVAVAIERFIFLNRARAENRKMWDQMLPLLQNGKFDKAQAVAGSGDVAIGKIVTYGIERLRTPHRREDVDAAMEEGMMEIVPRLEKRTHYIATFANVITLVGLLGTIIGLIKAFTAVANVNPAEKAELLAASISIAMNNTAFALMVAIPFLLIHAFLQARATEIVDSLEAAKISFLNLAQRMTAEVRRAQPPSHGPSPEAEEHSMRVRRLRREPTGLDVTAFINLIVVLVPFLLSTAVFTRLSVLDLSLPAQSTGALEQALGRKAQPRDRDPRRRDRSRRPHRRADPEDSEDPGGSLRHRHARHAGAHDQGEVS